MNRNLLERRAEQYAARNGLIIEDHLGSGVHGSVFSVARQPDHGQAAVKVHNRASDYIRERDVYTRLKNHEISEIRGCQVPAMTAFDDDLWIIEMTIVRRPFVLDFAGAVLDTPPEFPDEVLAEWRAEKSEQFGARWTEVQAILGFLQNIGIYLLDVNPGNISFEA